MGWQVPRAKMLACAVRMVSESDVPCSLLYVGKKFPDKVHRDRDPPIVSRPA
jgi:hypothetical protein